MSIGSAPAEGWSKATEFLGQSDAPYAALAREMNTSEGALKVAIHRLRKRYRELFRQEIADTVADPAEVESELRFLAAALARK
jgi:transposase-like protein